MRSRSKRGFAAACVLMAGIAFASFHPAPAWGAAPAAEIEQAQSEAIKEADVIRALENLKQDPSLAAERKMRMLRWKRDNEAPRKPSGGLEWLAELFAWLAQNGRFLFWGALAVLAAFLFVYLWRLVGGWRPAGAAARIDVPSFVRDLDIRPESLPADIGAAARELWDRGEHRAALALLYRGLLSRLAHVHNVPIRDSTTEGDCLALASKHLPGEERKIYVTSLVRAWQRAVYGGEDIPTESVHAICNEFARMLDASPSPGMGQVAGAPA